MISTRHIDRSMVQAYLETEYRVEADPPLTLKIGQAHPGLAALHRAYQVQTSAFITACVHNPKADEEEIAQSIRNASPTASPNARLVGHADALLGRGGRMSKAIEAIGRGDVSDEARAFSIPSTFGGPA